MRLTSSYLPKRVQQTNRLDALLPIAWGIDWRLPESPRRPLGHGRAEPVAGGDLAPDGRMAGGL